MLDKEFVESFNNVMKYLGLDVQLETGVKRKENTLEELEELKKENMLKGKELTDRRNQIQKEYLEILKEIEEWREENMEINIRIGKLNHDLAWLGDKE